MPSSKLRAHALPLLSWVLVVAGCGDPPAARPGVVLIVIDTLRADAVFDDDGGYSTPAMDELARDGIAFRQAFAHAPMTLPAHTSLFSSRPPFETGVLVNGVKLDPELPLLADWMSRFGYESRAAVSLGTLHKDIAVKPDPKKRGIAKGFESYDEDFWNMDRAPDVMTRLRSTLDEIQPDEAFFLFAHFCDPHEPYNAHGSDERTARVILDGKELATVSTSDMTKEAREVELGAGPHAFEVRADELMRVRGFQVWHDGRRVMKGVEWAKGKIAERRKHVRILFQAPEEGTYTLRYWVNDAIDRAESVARYRAEVSYVDGYIEELVRELQERGLYDGSFVILTSDHGEALGERDGFVGHVQTLYDEMIRVPLIIKPPAGSASAERLEERSGRLVSHADLSATILELVGLPELPGQRGVSILGDEVRPLVAETHPPEAARNLLCLRDERFKMIYSADDDRFEMYDITADPGEEEDLFERLEAERPQWPEMLRRFALMAASGRITGERDLEALKGLGYGG